MNTIIIAAIFAVLASANAGFIAAPSAKIIQGPSTRTTIAGPDGSVISAVAPGGSIVAEDHAGVVAHTAPLAYTAYAAPYLAHAAYAAPVAYGHGVVAQDTVVAGPSGTIATREALHAPFLHAPLAYHGLYY